MSLDLVLDGQAFEIDIEALDEGRYEVLVDGEPFEVEVSQEDGRTVSAVGDQRFTVQRSGRVLAVDGEQVDVAVRQLAKARIGQGAATGGKITPPMPGRIVEVLVTEGDEVEAGQGLIVLEAMKMQNEITAPGPSRVAEVLVGEGEAVEAEDVLVRLEPL